MGNIIVETTEGVSVDGQANDLTQDEAESSVERRNKAAEDLGIKTRYRIRA